MIPVSITERLPKGCRKRPVDPPLNDKRVGDLPERPLSVSSTSSSLQAAHPAIVKTRPGDLPEQLTLLSLAPSHSPVFKMGEAAHVDGQPYSQKSTQEESDNERIMSWIQDVNKQLRSCSNVTESSIKERTTPFLLAASPTGSMLLRLRDMAHATLEEAPISHPVASKETHCPQGQNEDACTVVLSRQASPDYRVIQAELCFGQHDLIPWHIDELPESPEGSLSVSSKIC